MDQLVASKLIMIEQHLRTVRAVEDWDRREPAGSGFPRGAGLLARFRALVGRSGRPAAQETSTGSAGAVGRERRSAGASG